MATPLRKTYSKSHPYIVERHDQEDGSITYEVWDYRPESYWRLCSLNDRDDYALSEHRDRQSGHGAKADAEMIVRALNLMNGGLP